MYIVVYTVYTIYNLTDFVGWGIVCVCVCVEGGVIVMIHERL